ncbi:MAG: outer membrane beta-barrel domain-containing protein [Myxococcaceae bacterium]
MRILFVVLALFPMLANAAVPAEVGSFKIVQNRQYQLKHELALGAGMLPLDAFYKGFTGNLSYTFHFTDHFAWQVGRASVSYNISTGLSDQLSRDFGLLTTDFPQVQWTIGSDLIWKLIYGKVALINRTLHHVEGFLIAGASGVKVQSGILPAPNVGVGGRLFLSDALSIRLDVTDSIVVGEKDMFNVLSVQLGLSLNFGS